MQLANQVRCFRPARVPRALVPATLAALALVAGVPAADAEQRRHRLVAGAKATRAVLIYLDMPAAVGSNPRIRIVRNGQELLSALVRRHPRAPAEAPVLPLGWRGAAPLAVRDLDGDGEPEVVVDVYWGGAHCCAWTRIYRFDRRRNSYVGITHWWGELKATYRFRDIDRDGRPEFVARDDRFMELSYYSADPVQVWAYRRGRFIDVTRRYPTLVRSDAIRWWRAYRARRDRWVREPLAAWAADQHLLGNHRLVDETLARALRSGALKPSLF